MKIALLNFYSGYISRGGETFVNELSRLLSKTDDVIVFQGGPHDSNVGYKVERISVSMRLPWPDPLPVTHPLRRLFLDFYKIKELAFSLKVLPQLKKFRPDIVIPMNSGWQALLVSLYCRFCKAKFVVVGQSGPGWDDRWNLLLKPDLFVALTRRQLDWAKRVSFWKLDFALIPNGVDLSKFKPQGEKAKLKLHKPVVLLVGASTPDKRIEDGIRAVAELKQGSLLLLGKGQLDQQIDELGKKLLGKDRFLHLSVFHEAMPPYYRAADVFTLCSVASEAFGIVYVEAMASGLACVAPDDSSRREIIGEAGIFVKNPVDAHEYSKALSQALTKKWSDIPRQQALKYSWDEIAAQYHEAFAKIRR